MILTSVAGTVRRTMRLCGALATTLAAVYPVPTQARQCDGWQEVQAPGPARRSGFSMAYMEREGRTLLFGGESYEDGHSVRYADTWTWDGAQWTDLHAGGPSPRSAASMAYDPLRDVILLYGGHASDGRPTDTWQWDGREWQRAGRQLVHAPHRHRSQSRRAHRHFSTRTGLGVGWPALDACQRRAGAGSILQFCRGVRFGASHRHVQRRRV